MILHVQLIGGGSVMKFWGVWATAPRQEWDFRFLLISTLFKIKNPKRIRSASGMKTKCSYQIIWNKKLGHVLCVKHFPSYTAMQSLFVLWHVTYFDKVTAFVQFPQLVTCLGWGRFLSGPGQSAESTVRLAVVNHLLCVLTLLLFFCPFYVSLRQLCALLTLLTGWIITLSIRVRGLPTALNLQRVKKWFWTYHSRWLSLYFCLFTGLISFSVKQLWSTEEGLIVIFLWIVCWGCFTFAPRRFCYWRWPQSQTVWFHFNFIRGASVLLLKTRHLSLSPVWRGDLLFLLVLRMISCLEVTTGITGWFRFEDSLLETVVNWGGGENVKQRLSCSRLIREGVWWL